MQCPNCAIEIIQVDALFCQWCDAPLKPSALSANDTIGGDKVEGDKIGGDKLGRDKVERDVINADITSVEQIVIGTGAKSVSVRGDHTIAGQDVQGNVFLGEQGSVNIFEASKARGCYIDLRNKTFAIVISATVVLLLVNLFNWWNLLLSPLEVAIGTPTATEKAVAAAYTPTFTPVPAKTPVETPTETVMPTPSYTPTSIPSLTNTPTDTPTGPNTPTETLTPTSTPSDTPTSTETPTNTPVPPTRTPLPGGNSTSWAAAKQTYYLRYQPLDRNREVRFTLVLQDRPNQPRLKDDVNIYLLTTDLRKKCQGIRPVSADGCHVASGNNQSNAGVVELNFPAGGTETGFWIAVANFSDRPAYYVLTIENGILERE